LPANSSASGETRLNFTAFHHRGQRFARRCLHYVGRQLQLSDVLLVVDDPSHLRIVHAVLVHQYAARPRASRDGVCPHPYFLPFEILGSVNSRVGAADDAPVMKAAQHKYRQGNKRRAKRARDDIGRCGKLAHVELNVSHHAAKGGNDGLDADEIRLDALDRNASILKRCCVSVVGDGHFQFQRVECGHRDPSKRCG
jgi:hypothetical protein